MIGGVTRHGLPHVRKVPHLHVKLPLDEEPHCGCAFQPAFVLRIE